MSQWLKWAKQLLILSRDGLAHTQDESDRERYHELHHIATDMLAQLERQTDEVIDNRLNETEETAQLLVRGVVFKEDRLLLVKDGTEGLWRLPGGVCRSGESPGANIIREIEEAAGFDVIPVRLLALFDRPDTPPRHMYTLFIECALLGEEHLTDVPTQNLGFFSREDLPEIAQTHHSLEQLHMCFDAHWQEADWTTLFD
ncbi:NUDIX hydrolase N-terminal domain-containing protein [Exiguobacterium algae]|uniref:NUDIX hydrolase N-terminal domain-containing protein n=1 Tax=Exiguobacterium algae TaxID=2751250 RepID=UPI001BE61292|nr:NUDIX hydrolase N-terminal domain-containing protein [Exiguobacterium algae]